MEKLKIKINKMRKKDISSIMEIERKAYGSFHWSESGFEAEIENSLGNYFVVKTNDEKEELLGYCGFWAILEEAHITTIAVKDTYRGNHLGELLLQQMIDTGYQKDIKWFTLEVRISNIVAQELYKKYGFQSLGLRKKYYQDTQEDALIMWTESIWSEKFKTKYTELKNNLQEKLDITINL